MATEVRKVPCGIWSRIVGYMRPTSQWSEAKRLEFEERKTFDRSAVILPRQTFEVFKTSKVLGERCLNQQS